MYYLGPNGFLGSSKFILHLIYPSGKPVSQIRIQGAWNIARIFLPLAEVIFVLDALDLGYPRTWHNLTIQYLSKYKKHYIHDALTHGHCIFLKIAAEKLPAIY